MGTISPTSGLLMLHVRTNNTNIINVYIVNSGTFLMPCIFGFNHQPLCPCQLINVKDSELDNLICLNCINKFRLDYDDFLSHESENWTGDFDDFLSTFIEDSLMHLRYNHIHACKFNYTDRQYISVIRKIDQMIENFRAREDERIDAKIESDNIASTLGNQIFY